MKKLSIFCAFVLIVGTMLLCACGGDDNGNGEVSGDTTQIVETTEAVESTEAVEETTESESVESVTEESTVTTEEVDDSGDFDGTWLVDAGKPMLDIVYSEKTAFDNVPSLAAKLADKLKESCGVEFSVYGDKAQAKNDALIVFGDTSDEFVLSQMKELDKGGYKIFSKDGNIVIVAFDSGAMSEAVEVLCGDVAQTAKKFSGGKKVGFSFADRENAGASDKKILIGENRIELYTIVYSASNRYGIDAALELRKNLFDTVGVELKVTDDTAPATKLEILVGVTNREESVTHFDTIGNKWKTLMGYEYRLINGKVSLVGADEGNYCVSLGCKNFTENLIDGEAFELNNSAIVKKSVKLQYDNFANRADGTDVRIMTANILSEEWGGSSPDKRVDLFYANICYYKPDVIGVQEVSLKWSEELKKIFEDSSYTLIHDKYPGNKTNYSAIIYNTATTELVDSGVASMSIGNPIGGRNMTWGIFKDKATQKMYVVINTHLDWINVDNPDSNGVNSNYSRETETKELIALYKEVTAKYKDLDVFLTADWNTEKDEHPFNILLNGLPIDFSQDLTENTDWGATEIDYILATKSTNILASHVYSTNSKVFGVSDHPFGFVDAKLK